MDIVNKTLLKKRLFGQRIKKQIIEYVRAIVEQFKHYKRVDKRFIEAFKASYPECHAYIIKNPYHDEIVFRWNEHNENFNDRPEVRVVKYHGFNQEITPITWEDIINDIERYKIDESIENYEHMIQQYDEDYNKIKTFKAEFDLFKKLIVNFTEPMWRIETALQEIITRGYLD